MASRDSLPASTPCLYVGMPRSIHDAKQKNKPNRPVAQGQTTSRIGRPRKAKPRAERASHAMTTASRNGEPRDDHGKPEWQATRRLREAGMASHAQAITRQSRRAGMASHPMDTTRRNGKNATHQTLVGSTLSTGYSTSCAQRVEELPWLGETREGIHPPQR